MGGKEVVVGEGGGRELRRALGYQCRKIQAAMQYSVRLTPRLLRSCGTVCPLFPRGTADAELMSLPLQALISQN